MEYVIASDSKTFSWKDYSFVDETWYLVSLDSWLVFSSDRQRAKVFVKDEAESVARMLSLMRRPKDLPRNYRIEPCGKKEPAKPDSLIE